MTAAVAPEAGSNTEHGRQGLTRAAPEKAALAYTRAKMVMPKEVAMVNTREEFCTASQLSHPKASSTSTLSSQHCGDTAIPNPATANQWTGKGDIITRKQSTGVPAQQVGVSDRGWP